MYQHLGIGILLLQFQYLLHGELLVHMACTIPQEHVSAGNTIYITTQVAVGTEDDVSVLRQRLHYLASIAAGNHYVGNRLCGRRGVYITYNGMTGMLGNELGKLVGRATLRQRAGSLQVGHKHLLVGTKYLACLAHEVHATHYYNVSIGGSGLLCQCQRIANEICHILNLTVRIVVRHYYGILLTAHPAYFFLNVHIIILFILIF